MLELGALSSPGHNGAMNSTTLPLVATSRITGKGHISSFLAGPFPPQFITAYITMAHEMGLLCSSLPLSHYPISLSSHFCLSSWNPCVLFLTCATQSAFSSCLPFSLHEHD